MRQRRARGMIDTLPHGQWSSSKVREGLIFIPSLLHSIDKIQSNSFLRQSDNVTIHDDIFELRLLVFDEIDFDDAVVSVPTGHVDVDSSGILGFSGPWPTTKITWSSLRLSPNVDEVLVNMKWTTPSADSFVSKPSSRRDGERWIQTVKVPAVLAEIARDHVATIGSLSTRVAKHQVLFGIARLLVIRFLKESGSVHFGRRLVSSLAKFFIFAILACANAFKVIANFPR
jgi:hypothetical protein